jgi:hypothetical protein
VQNYLNGGSTQQTYLGAAKCLGMHAYVTTRDGGGRGLFSGGKAFVETVAQQDAGEVPGAPLDATPIAPNACEVCPPCPPLAKGSGRTNPTEGVNAPL